MKNFYTHFLSFSFQHTTPFSVFSFHKNRMNRLPKKCGPLKIVMMKPTCASIFVLSFQKSCWPYFRLEKGVDAQLPRNIEFRSRSDFDTFPWQQHIQMLCTNDSPFYDFKDLLSALHRHILLKQVSIFGGRGRHLLLVET